MSDLNTKTIQSTSNMEEIALPVKGQFKPSKPFLSFISGTGTNIRLVTHTALLPLKELTGAFDSEDIMLRFTLCEEGTVNVTEEGETNFCDPEMLNRFVQNISERPIGGYLQKYVISQLVFKTDEGKICYLEVQNEKPIEKLGNLIDDLLTEKKNNEAIENQVSSKGLSLLDDLFSDIEDSKMEEVIVIDEGGTLDNVAAGPSALELAFQKLNEAKITELTKRLEDNLGEVSKLKYEVKAKEALMQTKSAEAEILKSRLLSLQPIKEKLGVFVLVSEENKTGIEADENLVKVVEKISPLLKLKSQAVIDLLTKGTYTISIGDLTPDFKLTKEIQRKIVSIDTVGNFQMLNDHQITYQGDLTYHEILDRLLREGFEQNAAFNQTQGSNSYESKEELIEQKAHSCADPNCTTEHSIEDDLINEITEEEVPAGLVKYQVVYSQDLPGDIFFSITHDALPTIADIQITDDETSITIKNKHQDLSHYNWGFLGISTAKRMIPFLKELEIDEDGNASHPSENSEISSGFDDVIYIPNFQGEIRLYQNDNQPFKPIDLNDYIEHQNDEGFYLRVPDGCQMEEFSMGNSLSFLRDHKLDQLLK